MNPTCLPLHHPTTRNTPATSFSSDAYRRRGLPVCSRCIPKTTIISNCSNQITSIPDACILYLENLLLASNFSLRYNFFIAFRFYNFHHICIWIRIIYKYLFKNSRGTSTYECYTLFILCHRNLHFSACYIPKYYLW